MNYTCMSRDELLLEKEKLQKEYDEYAKSGLNINMTRGKPCTEQLDITEGMLSVMQKNEDCFTDKGFDCRNYGLVDGLDDAKKMFSPIIGVPWDQIIIGGNSSLNLMYDAMARCMLYGVYGGNGPWLRQEKVKFLCPVPGYDRHFAICESLGVEMINVPLLSDGPDMDVVEELIKDEAVKGIWCVPKYSNPTGTTYSEKTVKRLACMKPASKDFRIFWDSAYAVHDLYEDEKDELLDILPECEKAGNANLVFIFASTSKISFPGSGVSCIGASKENIDHIKSIMQMQTIGHDKMNMLRHVKFFKNADGIKEFMKKHADILRPKFEVCEKVLSEKLSGLGVASWTKPLGGYFVSLDVLDGCAKRVVSLAKEAGVVMTDAGATFPYHNDPKDNNMRIAPSFPPVSELETGMYVLCTCVKLASVEKLLEK
ncbi:MAG: aminotransferase class I/II-fold pyridoxal phosphate-dependent enzyme [Clostridia bacterium]|nr:aminotransferase class I/II-fold pyridoxal phosphate-dependent enzyme [Clostridia bacterium]